MTKCIECNAESHKESSSLCADCLQAKLDIVFGKGWF